MRTMMLLVGLLVTGGCVAETPQTHNAKWLADICASKGDYTAAGMCVGFLTAAHDRLIASGTLNNCSIDVADLHKRAAAIPDAISWADQMTTPAIKVAEAIVMTAAKDACHR